MITLKTLPEATSQQVFDQAVEHLRIQKGKSYREGNSCAYRGDNGTRCAAGCLISDDEYSIEMENSSWATLECKGLVPMHHSYLITNLQEVHDNVDTEDWENSFKKVASSFKLEYKEPQQ